MSNKICSFVWCINKDEDDAKTALKKWIKTAHPRRMLRCFAQLPVLHKQGTKKQYVITHFPNQEKVTTQYYFSLKTPNDKHSFGIYEGEIKEYFKDLEGVVRKSLLFKKKDPDVIVIQSDGEETCLPFIGPEIRFSSMFLAVAWREQKFIKEDFTYINFHIYMVDYFENRFGSFIIDSESTTDSALRVHNNTTIISASDSSAIFTNILYSKIVVSYDIPRLFQILGIIDWGLFTRDLKKYFLDQPLSKIINQKIKSIEIEAEALAMMQVFKKTSKAFIRSDIVLNIDPTM